MFYDNFVKACISAGKSPSAVVVEAGISKPAVTRWKNGQQPTDASLQKLSEYFGISKDDLLNGKKSPPPAGDGLTEEFSRIFAQLSPENQNAIIAEMLKRQRQEQ